jgi:hypothetical protein
VLRRIIPWLVAFSLFAAAALTLQLSGPGTRTFAEVPDVSAGRIAPARPETLPLPSLRAGVSVSELSDSLGPELSPHAVATAPALGAEEWEWSEPAGRYVLGEFRGGGLVSGSVRRPYGPNLPAVEARVLHVLRVGASRAGIERVAGRGWPVERALLADGGETVTQAWAIRDRGIGTGHVLRITYRDGRAIAVDHPWVAR